MKKQLLRFSILILFASCTPTKQRYANNREQINTTLDSWHKAASQARFDEYFSLMTAEGVFVGTDATENWQNKDFRAFSKPYFDKGRAWTYTPLQRNIYLNQSQNTAWFDELLDSQIKICRGSGVLVKENGKWKIAHYVLSMTVPNEKAMEVVKLKTAIEDSLINKIKSK